MIKQWISKHWVNVFCYLLYFSLWAVIFITELSH